MSDDGAAPTNPGSWPPAGPTPSRTNPAWAAGPATVLVTMPWQLVLALAAPPWLIVLRLAVDNSDQGGHHASSTFILIGVLAAAAYSTGAYFLVRGPALVAGYDWISRRSLLPRWTTVRFADVSTFRTSLTPSKKKGAADLLTVTLVVEGNAEESFRFGTPRSRANGDALVSALLGRGVTQAL